LRSTLRRDAIRRGFKQSVNHPFTQSIKMDREFASSLTARDRAMFDQAKRTRANILTAFNAMKEPAQ